MHSLRDLQASVVALALVACAACSRDSAAADADNTGRNQRDADGATMTPVDQGSSEADVALTQRVRQALVADDALSINAKNVKVITRDGTVTLRGVVDSVEERTRVASTASAVAGVGECINELEVQSK